VGWLRAQIDFSFWARGMKEMFSYRKCLLGFCDPRAFHLPSTCLPPFGLLSGYHDFQEVSGEVDEGNRMVVNAISKLVGSSG